MDNCCALRDNRLGYVPTKLNVPRVGEGLRDDDAAADGPIGSRRCGV